MYQEKNIGFPSKDVLNELVILALDPRVVEISDSPEGKEVKEFKLSLTRLAVLANFFGDRKITLLYNS